VRWEKNTVAVTKSMAKAFIPNGRIMWKLPTAFQEKLMLSFQETYIFSRYVPTSYIANQKIGFLQLTWDKK
jgi:outer membrane receptor for ferrienterochelin and colicins